MRSLDCRSAGHVASYQQKITQCPFMGDRDMFTLTKKIVLATFAGAALLGTAQPAVHAQGKSGRKPSRPTVLRKGLPGKPTPGSLGSSSKTPIFQPPQIDGSGWGSFGPGWHRHHHHHRWRDFGEPWLEGRSGGIFEPLQISGSGWGRCHPDWCRRGKGCREGGANPRNGTTGECRSGPKRSSQPGKSHHPGSTRK